MNNERNRIATKIVSLTPILKGLTRINRWDRKGIHGVLSANTTSKEKINKTVEGMVALARPLKPLRKPRVSCRKPRGHNQPQKTLPKTREEKSRNHRTKGLTNLKGQVKTGQIGHIIHGIKKGQVKSG